SYVLVFFVQAEDGIRDDLETGVQTCALPIYSRGMIAVSGRQHDVTREDTLRAIEAARAVSIPNTREILHVIPRGYVVDGQEGVQIGRATCRERGGRPGAGGELRREGTQRGGR